MAKLSDTQLIILSAATQREDGIAALPDRVRGGAALKVINPLLTRGLVEEIPAQPGMPVWRRDSNGARSYSLAITRAGRAVINVDHSDSERASKGGAHNEHAMTPRKPGANTVSSKRKRHNHVATAQADRQRDRQKSQSPELRADSKQNQVIAMLRKPGGATIAAIMKVTRWQQHSVRGFFAAIVRKKMKLNLSSVKTAGCRTYRIIGG